MAATGEQHGQRNVRPPVHVLFARAQARREGIIATLVAVVRVALAGACACSIWGFSGQRRGRAGVLEAVKELGGHAEVVAHGFAPKVALLNAEGQTQWRRFVRKRLQAPSRVTKELKPSAALL